MARRQNLILPLLVVVAGVYVTVAAARAEFQPLIKLAPAAALREQPAEAQVHYEVKQMPAPEAVPKMTTDDLRSNFVVERVFVPGDISLTYTYLDRMVVGGAMPVTSTPLSLKAAPASAKVVGKGSFLDRRELGIFNVGGAGRVVADGVAYELAPHEALYVAAGTQDVTFASDDPAGAPAKFYLVSTPCASRLTTKKVSLADAKTLHLGAQATANVRTLHQMIVPGRVDTCQLMLGATFMANGSVWNTMPAHRHSRRSEIYLYFDLPESQRVFHLMGEPAETRHVVMANEQAVLSPSWSIHAGAGSSAYGFVWVMAGENEDFGDMDPVSMAALQ
jgi:4-deoxy-L-threo-5-hexosulose-uronate ketol-isomerase